jgi:hypothetical protein
MVGCWRLNKRRLGRDGLGNAPTGLSIRGLRVRIPSASLNGSSRKQMTCGYCRFQKTRMLRPFGGILGAARGWRCIHIDPFTTSRRTRNRGEHLVQRINGHRLNEVIVEASIARPLLVLGLPVSFNPDNSRNRRASSKPLMPGIAMSEKTRSGLSRRAASNAAGPFVNTRTFWPRISSSLVSARPAAAESSNVAHIRPDVNPGMAGLLKEQPGSHAHRTAACNSS